MTLLLPVISVFAVLACHWFGLRLIRAVFETSLARFGPRGGWGEDLSLGIAVLMLVAWMFVDVSLSAIIVVLRDGGVDFNQAFLFAISSFTTLGTNQPQASPFWEMAGPLIAMCGIFIFGWTTSFLIDCTHAVREMRRTATAHRQITTG